jgi:hypothetical protein
MVPALLAALGGPVGAVATDFLIYVAFGLLLIGLADAVTARAVIPAGSGAERRGRNARAPFPAIFAGLVAGIFAVHFLPEWFPNAAFAEPLRESLLVIGNW